MLAQKGSDSFNVPTACLCLCLKMKLKGADVLATAIKTIESSRKLELEKKQIWAKNEAEFLPHTDDKSG